jgi:hypothetical protein
MTFSPASCQDPSWLSGSVLASLPDSAARHRAAFDTPAVERPAARYAAPVTQTAVEKMGWFRTAVGAVLIAAPGPFLRLSRRKPPTGASILLLRTIGIRDLVLGLGTVAAARSEQSSDVRRWSAATLASDSLDMVASVASMRSIGRLNSVAAAAVALLAVSGDIQALRTTHRVVD